MNISKSYTSFFSSSDRFRPLSDPGEHNQLESHSFDDRRLIEVPKRTSKRHLSLPTNQHPSIRIRHHHRMTPDLDEEESVIEKAEKAFRESIDRHVDESKFRKSFGIQTDWRFSQCQRQITELFSYSCLMASD